MEPGFPAIFPLEFTLGSRRQIGIITVDMGFIFAYANVTANIYESSGFRMNVPPWKMQRVCLRFLKAYLCTFSLR